MSLRGGRSPTRQPLQDCSYVKRLVDRRRPVAGPAGALRASKFAPGEFVVAALLAMTLVIISIRGGNVRKSDVIARRAGANSRRATSLRAKRSNLLTNSSGHLGDCRVGLRPPRNDAGDSCRQRHFPSAFRDRQQPLRNQ
jgi:hypothetical protein